MWLRGQRSLAGHPSGEVCVAGGGEQCPEIYLPLPTSMPSQPASRLSPLSPQSCNTSCPSGFHGNNCSVPCECPEGNCDPVSGACQLGSHSQDAALVAGILVPLLLLLLAIACCACCCWAARLDPKDRPVRDGTAMSRMKLRVWGALTSSLGSALPCGPLSSHKLPWVTVSHHDPEIPFNHSFIEPPSAGWASDDSFSSDSESGEEDEGPAYCVPPQEGSPQTASCP